MDKIYRIAFLAIFAIPQVASALTATVTFSEPPAGAETWVFVGTQDCGVDASGVMPDKTKCPNGAIAAVGKMSVDIGNIPPGQTIYATAKHVWRTTGQESNYAKVVSSAVPPLPMPAEPIPFPAPVIIQWPSGSMTIQYK